MRQNPEDIARHIYRETPKARHQELFQMIIWGAGVKDPILFRDVIREYRVLQSQAAEN